MSHIHRRDVLKVGLAGFGALMLPEGLLAQMRPRLNAEHFFLQILLQPGADFTYLFDARPLAMTAAGKIQNYLGEDPIAYAGVNGGSCLRTKLTDPLMPFKSKFSVINGVMMAPNFEGHIQNLNLFMTGNPFGGASFLPELNWEIDSASPLDGILSGFSFASTNNHGKVVPIDAEASVSLAGLLNRLPPLGPDDELGAHLRARMEANGAGTGRFSAGSRQMAQAFGGMPGLHDKLKKIVAPGSSDPEERFVEILGQLFRQNVSRSALWIVTENLDTHDAGSAKAQPATFAKITAMLAKVFGLLERMPFDNSRSMLDVTTVMVNSEFGRTMRIEGRPVDDTGTNHNAFCNSVLIGGRGIRGGQVIGASDFQTAGETLSGAHLQMEPKQMSIMARPFDFASGRPRADLPAAFDVEDYLNIGSVVNTVYQAFNVDRSRWRINTRGGSAAPVIPGLLV